MRQKLQSRGTLVRATITEWSQSRPRLLQVYILRKI